MIKLVKEMMKSGMPQKMAIASSIAKQRKIKQMAMGGQVMDETEEAPRSLGELMEEGDMNPADIMNPEELEESSMFAKAIKNSTSKEMGFSEGGEVEEIAEPMPMAMELSPEAKEALIRKRMSRKYGMYDPKS